MKILLNYLVIGCIITIVRMVTLPLSMRKGALPDRFKGLKGLNRYILVEVLFGTLIWPAYPIMIVWALWLLTHGHGDEVNKMIDEVIPDYFE